MFSIINVNMLIIHDSLAFAGGTDSYHGYISAVAEWDADLYITANDDYAGASTTIYPVSRQMPYIARLTSTLSRERSSYTADICKGIVT